MLATVARAVAVMEDPVKVVGVEMAMAVATVAARVVVKRVGELVEVVMAWVAMVAVVTVVVVTGSLTADTEKVVATAAAMMVVVMVDT